MRKDIEKAKDRLIQTIKNATGVDLTGKIDISVHSPGDWTRYKIEQITDAKGHHIERHLSQNLTHGQMLIALDTTQRLIENMIELDFQGRCYGTGHNKPTDEDPPQYSVRPLHYIILEITKNQSQQPAKRIYHDRQEAYDQFNTVPKIPHYIYHLIVIDSNQAITRLKTVYHDGDKWITTPY